MKTLPPDCLLGLCQMRLTKRFHYNPCFWTALWNPVYYERFRAGQELPVARSQQVDVLSVKADKVFRCRVDKVHYDTGLGPAEIGYEGALRFVKKYRPERYEQFAREAHPSQYPVLIDPEQLFAIMESADPYCVLLKVAKSFRIESLEDKVFLAFFIVLHGLRSHAVLRASLETLDREGVSRFEAFVTLKWLLEDRGWLLDAVAPYIGCQWTLFLAGKPTFPLCDTPILSSKHDVMVALSPRLLLQIEFRIKAAEQQWRLKKGVSAGKVAEFRRRTIGNTFREILFSEADVLSYWQSTREFRSRVDRIGSGSSYADLLEK